MKTNIWGDESEKKKRSGLAGSYNLRVAGALPRPPLERNSEILSTDNDITVGKNPNTNEITIKFASAVSAEQDAYLKSEGYDRVEGNTAASVIYRKSYEPEQEVTAGVEARRVGDELRKLIPGINK